MKSNTTDAATITELRKIFAKYGLPEQLVSDKGPEFVSAEFTQFLKSNGVKHIKSAPYHPRLDLLRPNMEGQVVNKQANQKVTHDQHS